MAQRSRGRIFAPFNSNFSTMSTRNTLLFFFVAFLLLPFLGQSQNTVYTLAGSGFPGYFDGDSTSASFNNPRGIAIDTQGNLFVVDGNNNVVRKITPTGTVSTLAGTPGVAGYLDGPAASAQFSDPYNICIDPAGNLFVSDFQNHRIRKIDTNGMVSTVAGSGVDGWLDGSADSAQFNYPRGICVDDAGNLYVGDSWNHRIRKIDTNGMVTTFAGFNPTIGVQTVGSWMDGSDTTARFYTPTELSIDTANNIYVADAFNHRIRKIDPNRVVTTIAGSGVSGSSGGGFQNGPGPQALFNVPTAVHATLEGDLFVGDGGSHRVRRIDNNNFVTTFAGSGGSGLGNGPDSLATFNFPRGIVKDYARNRMYVVDVNNNVIRYIQLATITALNDPKEYGISTFPNPFENRVQLHLSNWEEGLEVVVYNSLGQQVSELLSLSSSQTTIELDHLPSGIYQVVLLKAGQVIFSDQMLKRATH